MRIWLFTALLLPYAVQAASFDCAKARAPDERAICADRYLNDQDVRMYTMLGVLGSVQLMGGNGAMRDDQRAWLTSRQRCAAKTACLKRAYDRRVSELMNSYHAYANTVR